MQGTIARTTPARTTQARATVIRELDHEANVRAISLCYCCVGVALVGDAAIHTAHRELGLVLCLGCFAAAAFVIGQSLWTFNPAARPLAVALSVLGAEGLVWSIARGEGVARLGAAFLVLYQGAAILELTDPCASRVFGERYRAVAAAEPTSRRALLASPFFYLPASMAVLGLVAVLAG